MRKLSSLLAILIGIAGISYAQSKLSIHGYLTQAYAITNGRQIFGITRDGTSDYRALALQFRYDLDERNNFVIQFAHERVGQSPVMGFKEDVELDWAFYEYRPGPSTSIKVGKIQLPYGIYNEIRDVGTLIPFYRLPYSPYGEGSYMNETVDGLSFSYTLGTATAWEFAFDAYAGHWNWREWFKFRDLLTNQLVIRTGESDIEKGMGAQVWITTPIEGARLALGGQIGEVKGGLTFSEDGLLGQQTIRDAYLSLDLTREHFFVRSEYLGLLFTNADLFVSAYYVHGGFHLNDIITINWQADFLTAHDVDIPDVFIPMVNKTQMDFKYNKDYTIGIKLNLSSQLAFKAEHHWNSGFFVEDAFVNPYLDKPLKSRYAIFSLSAVF